MPQFRTEFMGYSVEWSPFDESLLAVATAQHFGIVGNGKQYIMRVDPRTGALNPIAMFDSRDGLYDCTWSEENDSVILAGAGDGTLKLWDLKARDPRPIQDYHEHRKEVYSVDWNLVGKNNFLSGSWDHTIKLWDPRRKQSLRTFADHRYVVYSTIWSPYSPYGFASASGDRTLRVWDAREPRAVQTIAAHDQEVLTCDWNKYAKDIIFTGSVDNTVKLWDLRNPRRELQTLRGHGLAVRRLKTSPHHESVLASCSYDMSIIVWDLDRRDDPIVRRYDHHTEFVAGLDFNMFLEGKLASCAWDQTVEVLDIAAAAPPLGGAPRGGMMSPMGGRPAIPARPPV